MDFSFNRLNQLEGSDEDLLELLLQEPETGLPPSGVHEPQSLRPLQHWIQSGSLPQAAHQSSSSSSADHVGNGSLAAPAVPWTGTLLVPKGSEQPQGQAWPAENGQEQALQHASAASSELAADSPHAVARSGLGATLHIDARKEETRRRNRLAMRKHRAKAAAARQDEKQHVAELEQQLLQLQLRIGSLEEECAELRQQSADGNAPPSAKGGTMPALPPYSPRNDGLAAYEPRAPLLLYWNLFSSEPVCLSLAQTREMTCEQHRSLISAFCAKCDPLLVEADTDSSSLAAQELRSLRHEALALHWTIIMCLGKLRHDMMPVPTQAAVEACMEAMNLTRLQQYNLLEVTRLFEDDKHSLESLQRAALAKIHSALEEQNSQGALPMRKLFAPPAAREQAQLLSKLNEEQGVRAYAYGKLVWGHLITDVQYAKLIRHLNFGVGLRCIIAILEEHAAEDPAQFKEPHPGAGADVHAKYASHFDWARKHFLLAQQIQACK